MRDAADGTIDSPEIRARLIKEIEELIKSAQQIRNLLHQEKA